MLLYCAVMLIQHQTYRNIKFRAKNDAMAQNRYKVISGYQPSDILECLNGLSKNTGADATLETEDRWAGGGPGLCRSDC